MCNGIGSAVRSAVVSVTVPAAVGAGGSWMRGVTLLQSLVETAGKEGKLYFYKIIFEYLRR